MTRMTSLNRLSEGFILIIVYLSIGNIAGAVYSQQILSDSGRNNNEDFISNNSRAESVATEVAFVPLRQNSNDTSGEHRVRNSNDLPENNNPSRVMAANHRVGRNGLFINVAGYDQVGLGNDAAPAARAQTSAPSLQSMSRAYSQRRLQMILGRRRDRERRVQNLRRTILRSTGLTRHTPLNTGMRQQALAAFNRFNLRYPNYFHQRHTDKICYKAQCSLPDATDSMLWSNDSSPFLRLFFRVPRLNRRGAAQENQLDQARLKLFVNPARECPCPEGSEPEVRPEHLLITVHQLKKPLSFRRRNNRVLYRRQLLDQVVVPGDGNLWVWLDVKLAVNMWMARPKRNFGLELIVSDLNGTVLDAKEILALPSCEEGTERSCREDDSQRVQRVRWPTMTLGEDLDPYIDVVTGTKIEVQTFSLNTPFPVAHLRRRRSALSSQIAKKPRAITGFAFFKQALKQNGQKLHSKSTTSQDRNLEKISKDRLKQLRRSHNKECSCNPTSGSSDSHSIKGSDQKAPGLHRKSAPIHHPHARQATPSGTTQSSKPSKTSVGGKPLPLSCRGKKVSLKIKDASVIAPIAYKTLQCPSTCRSCSHGKCRRKSCQPVQHAVWGIVNDPSGQMSYQVLSGVLVTSSCGC